MVYILQALWTLETLRGLWVCMVSQLDAHSNKDLLSVEFFSEGTLLWCSDPYWPSCIHSDMRGTGIFKTDFIWILDKNKKWIQSHFWTSLNKSLPFCTTYLRKVAFPKSTIIKCKNDPYWKMLRMFFSMRFLRMDPLWKNHELHPFHFHYAFFYYFIVSFMNCVHFYDFPIDKNANWDLKWDRYTYH